MKFPERTGCVVSIREGCFVVLFNYLAGNRKRHCAFAVIYYTNLKLWNTKAYGKEMFWKDIWPHGHADNCTSLDFTVIYLR
jgi:hypothetical protein